MISGQTVYITEDRSKAVKEGDPKAKFLLVRAGHEVAEAEVEKYDGASELVNAKPKKQEPVAPVSLNLKGDDNEGPQPENREADLNIRKRSSNKRKRK